MKRIGILLMLVLCCVGLCMPAWAWSGAEQVRSETTVSEDGSCSVVLTATIHLEEPVQSPVFPVPKNAENITLNGSPATVHTAAASRMVSLKDVTGGSAGDWTIAISYDLPSVVASTKKDGLVLTLPILSGFPYPVTELSFSVTLPDDVPERPSFTSAYHQAEIQSFLEITVSGKTITGRTLEPLKDHESLTMTLPVDEKMFPETARTARVLSYMDLAIAAVALVAVVYYLLALRPVLPRRPLQATAPDGLSAGDMPLWLTGRGMDLSMLVITWAELGYIRIQVEDSGRVLLHKRMEMGNERSIFENRCYRDLFGRRRIVDGTGAHYAQMVRTVAKKAPRSKEVYRSGSGSGKVFLALCAVAAVLSGIGMAGAFAAYSTVLRVFLAILLGIMALLLQAGGRCLLLRKRMPLWIALGCGALWLILGVWSGEWLTAVLMVLFQFAAGLAGAYGGKRTELGQQTLEQILGLRRFMRTASKPELQRLLRSDPAYFHELAPYALALGVDKTFAKRFGRLRLPECTYLVGPARGQMTAAEWAQLLRITVSKLDARAKRLPLEKITGR